MVISQEHCFIVLASVFVPVEYNVDIRIFDLSPHDDERTSQ